MLAFLVAAAVALPGLARAQEAPAAPWRLLTRVLVTGSSDHSEPEGYVAYSTFALEAALRRALTGRLALELAARTESREINRRQPGGPEIRLGSAELLPLNLLLQYSLRSGGGFRPYAAAGAHFTVAWEKSGAIDSHDLSPTPGVAVALGADWDAGRRVVVNTDLRWNSYRPDLEIAGAHVANLKLDPLTLGIGLGFSF